MTFRHILMLDRHGDELYNDHSVRIAKTIGSKMRMKFSGGEECVIKFLGNREGFHRVCFFDDSSSEYAPLIR